MNRLTPQEQKILALVLVLIFGGIAAKAWMRLRPVEGAARESLGLRVGGGEGQAAGRESRQ